MYFINFFILALTLLFSLNINAEIPSYSKKELKNAKIFLEDNPPYNFLDKNKEPHGIFVDLLDSTLKDLNIEKSKHDYKMEYWVKALHDLVNSTEKNLLLAITKGQEREHLYKWVGPIINTNLILYTKKNNNITISSENDLKKYRYGVLTKNIATNILIKKGVLNSNIQSYKEIFQLIKDINDDKIDIFILNQLSTAPLLTKYGYDINKFKNIETLSIEPLFIACNKSFDNKTIEILQKSIDKKLTDPIFMQKILERYQLINLSST